jgi:hypothetical protein
MDNMIGFFVNLNVSSILSFVMGAVLTALIGYFFTKQREKNLLKLKLQVETTEQLLSKTKNLFNYTFEEIITVKIDLETYNSILEKYYNIENQKEIGNSFSSENSMLKMARNKSKSIRDNMNIILEKRKQYGNLFFDFIFYIEARQVILKKFIPYHTNLLNHYKELMKIFEELHSNIYFSNISNNLSNDKIIENYFIEQIGLVDEKIINSTNMIDINLKDFETGLQNEFLSKIFGGKVPYRKPLLKKYKITKPQGKLHIKIKNCLKNLKDK